ncbi:hypothetical protein [Caballeronia sp.]|jgi:hypothetical protein|uniref:hypothetical protein n=1 Tax=Caballeronia sp. TaxID=1931223 RepID=UPI00260554EB|nr:hypothetical protein [Caballeronia sp.]
MSRPTLKNATYSMRAPTVSATRPRRITRAWLAVIIGVAGLVGGYQFQRILSALPDSNDDFIFF